MEVLLSTSEASLAESAPLSEESLDVGLRRAAKSFVRGFVCALEARVGVAIIVNVCKASLAYKMRLRVGRIDATSRVALPDYSSWDIEL